jgi:hypothetical protein
MRFFTSFVASNVEGIGHAIFAAPFLPITVTQMAICVCVCVCRVKAGDQSIRK